jgi:isopenicillin-N epimerase
VAGAAPDDSIELHRAIGRDRIAARIQSLNATFRGEVAKIAGVTLHTPRDPAISAGMSCFEIRGLTAEETTTRLAAKRIRTSPSPYKVAYARVSAGIANRPEDIDVALREISALARS